MRHEIFRDGVRVALIDDRTLAEAQADRVQALGEELEARIMAALGVDRPEAAAFVQINAMQGWYDAQTNAQITATVKGLRDQYYAMKAAVLALTTVDEVATYQAVWQ